MQRNLLFAGLCTATLLSACSLSAPSANFRQSQTGTGSSAAAAPATDSGAATDFINERTPETHDSLEVPMRNTGAVIPVTLASGAIVMGDPGQVRRIVVTTDYDCLYCRDVGLGDLPWLLETFVAAKQLTLERRFLPLSPSGTLSARAAICSAKKGKFAEADRILTARTLRTDKDLPTFAKSLKITLKDLTNCMNAPSTKAILDRMGELADAAQVSRIPAFSLGTEQWIGVVSRAELEGKIRAYLSNDQ